MPNAADYFGRTYVVNLPERKDRLKAITRDLNALAMGFSHPKVELFCATRCHQPEGFPSAAVRGCFLSHLQILRNARAHGLPSVLIMEDDLAISQLFASSGVRLIQQADQHPWGFLYFGHQEALLAKIPEWRPYSGPLATTHFYAVSARIFDGLIAYLEAVQSRMPGDPSGGPMHYDGALSMFRQSHPDVLTLVAQPSMGWQRPSRSDIHGNWYDRLPVVRETAQFARGAREKLRGLKTIAPATSKG